MKAHRLPLVALAVTVFAVAASGCGAKVGALKEAVSADLNCPKSRVHVLGPGKTRDVEACGQRATYHYEDGDWRMIARSVPAVVGVGVTSGGMQPGAEPVTKAGAIPVVAPAAPAPTMSPTGTPSMPPSSPPPPAAPGQKAL